MLHYCDHICSRNTIFLHTVIGIELDQDSYDFNEGDGTVLVCAIVDFLSTFSSSVMSW